MATNSVSLFGALKVDGYNLVENPSQFYRDANAEYITFVRLLTAKIQGVLQTGFYIAYINPKGLTQEYFFLPVRANLQNLTDFKNGLLALNTYKNTFTLYTGLVKTSNQPTGFFTNLPALQKQVLVNDDKCDTNYLASKQQTAVTIKTAPNILSAFVMYFTGDQNSAGQYLYFTSSGN